MSLVVDRDVNALLIAYRRHGDTDARDQLLVDLMPLVRALASRYAGRGEPLEDLVQVGALGLIKAEPVNGASGQAPGPVPAPPGPRAAPALAPRGR